MTGSLKYIPLLSKGFGILLLSLLIPFDAFTQRNWPFELWHEGKVVLEAGDTLKGLIKYDLQQDLVQHALNNRSADVYTARKVLFFEIFDESENRYRRFFALPYNTSTGYKTPIFFELLEEGRMTLLAREFLEYKTYSSPYFLGYSRLMLDHKYFFLNEDGSIEEFKGTKNDLLDLMGKHGDAVDKFIRENRLRFDEKLDFARIINYYNSFFSS